MNHDPENSPRNVEIAFQVEIRACVILLVLEAHSMVATCFFVVVVCYSENQKKTRESPNSQYGSRNLRLCNSGKPKLFSGPGCIYNIEMVDDTSLIPTSDYCITMSKVQTSNYSIYYLET